jgi:hypothetical protein
MTTLVSTFPALVNIKSKTMKLRFLLLLLFFAPLPLLAQDFRPSCYQGQAGVITVRGGKMQAGIGGVVNIPTQDITPAAGTVTYFFLNLNGVPAVVTNTTGYPATNYFPICTVTKDGGGTITALVDSRPEYYFGGNVAGTLPNTNLACSATPAFDGTTNAAYSMTLCQNVTSSTVTGSPINGTLMAMNLCEDGTGGWTFTFPASFTVPAGLAFNTTANACNYLTWKYNGTNWTLISTSGSGAGVVPAGNNGDVQIKSGSSLAASGANDNGTSLNVSRNLSTKGPNPFIDVTMFGARATAFNAMPATTCTINSGSTTMSLPGGASTFINGDGIVCRGAGANVGVSTPSAPTVVPSSVTGPTGTGQTAAAAAGAITNQYCVVAADIGGGFSPCSAVTSVATANSLGVQTVTATSWIAQNAGIGSIVTVTTSAPHTLVVGTYISIVNDPNLNGFWKVNTVPDNTHFTFITANQVAFGFPASGGALATIYYWQANHITWPEVTNAIRYYVYGRTAGAMNLIGVTAPQSSTLCPTCLSGNPGPPTLVANMFDDYGASLTQNLSGFNVPDYVPTTPPVAAKNKDLVTTIVSGAGTTTLTVSGAASNSVVAQTMRIDNVGPIQLAINAATLNGSTTQGVLFFPATGQQGFQYETNSPLQLYCGSIGTLSIQQAGQINLGDMIYTLGGNNGARINWTGTPLNPNAGTASFSRGSWPQISTDHAWPMFYAANKGINFKNIVFSNRNPNQGYTYVADQGGGIPASTWENMVFVSGGANDTMNILFLIRGDSNGGADFTFTHVSFLTGPGSQAPGVTTTPAFYGDGMSSPILAQDTFLSLRTIYFRMLPQGLTAVFEQIYDEGGIEPMIGAYFTGGSAGLNLEMRGAVADTMGAPMFSYFGTMSGTAKIVPYSQVGSGQPFANGPGGIAIVGAGPAYAYGTVNTYPNIAVGLDGVMNTGNGIYSTQNINSALSVPNPLQFFVAGGTTTPTCSVAAGGSAPLTSYIYRVAPVFPNGGALAEGTYGPSSNTCTTTGGNQTVNISWPAVPGAVGYDVSENNISLGCNPGYRSGGNTNFFQRNAVGPSPCGFPPSPTAGGVTSAAGGGLSAAALRLNNVFSATLTATALTANRTHALPDASGTVLLDTTTTTAAGLAPSPYDNFNRANGGLGANWTTSFSTNGALTISSNTVINSAANDQNSYWTATPFNADQYAEVTIGATTPLAQGVGVSLRNSGTTNATTNLYACVQDQFSVVLWKFTNGAQAFMTSTAHTAVAGDRVRGQIIGINLTCTVTSALGATTTITISDSAFPTGPPGIVIRHTVGTLVNWTAGSIPNNSAYVTTTLGEQQFNGHQHINNGALVVGNYPPASTGSALINGQFYSQGGISDLSTTASLPLCTDANKKFVTGGTDCTAAIASTLTNKTIDAEGTGNLITIPFKPFIGAALCNNATAGPSMNLPTAAAPTVNCRTGSNVQEGTLDFADADSAQFGYMLPSDWTGAIDARALFFSPDTSGTVIWNIATACAAVNGSATDDTAFNTASAFGTVTLGATANGQWVATVTGITASGCSAGNGITFKVSRAADSATSRARLKGIELTMRRAM